MTAEPSNAVESERRIIELERKRLRKEEGGQGVIKSATQYPCIRCRRQYNSPWHRLEDAGLDKRA